MIRRALFVSLLTLTPLLEAATPAELWRIRLLQDRRSAAVPELVRMLSSADETIREHALLALANVQDTAAVRPMLPLLSDRRSAVRRMAAFAVGMCGGPSAAPALIRRITVETDARSVEALFDAVGSCGTKEDLKSLMEMAESFEPRWNLSFASCLARFANRRISHPAATEALYAILSSDETSLLSAVYALSRIPDSSAARKHRADVLPLLRHRSPVVRMWGSTIAGMIGSEAVTPLLTAAEKDRDWRVRVNALRALRSSAGTRSRLLALGADRERHVAQTAVTVYGALCRSYPEQADSGAIMTMLASPEVAPAVKDELRGVLAGRLGTSAVPLLGRWETDSPVRSARIVRAYGETGSVDALPFIQSALRGTAHSAVTIAALEAYGAVAAAAGTDVQRQYLRTLILAFDRKDAGVSYTAAAAFQDTSFPAAMRKEHLPSLHAALSAMRSPADLEPMVELLKALESVGDSTSLSVVRTAMTSPDKTVRSAAARTYAAITGEEPGVEDLPQAYAPFFTDADSSLLSAYSAARVVTTRGTVTIRFEKQAAPLTVISFVKLAQRGFYDGLPFHRVVSNFVIQGGDPLGNGSGGPEYTIRTEVHPSARYGTGTVGMASAGRDTEGSQWFITHCPVPHLDHRYTVFGTTKDMAVVNALHPGDVVRRVELLK